MENPTPFDLNEAIRRWQKELAASPAFCADNLEELASHLRASVQRLKATGLSEEEAFLSATRRIGDRGPLEREFAKINPAVRWPQSLVLFWTVAGIYLFQVISQLVLSLFVSCINLSLNLVPVMSLLAELGIVLGVRLTKGTWRGFAPFVRTFGRPIRAVLGLVALGVGLAFLPEFLTSLLGRANPLTIGLGIAQVGKISHYELWLGGFIRLKFATFAGYVAGQVAVNLVLALGMDLLARHGLRKIAPAFVAPAGRES